ncbi:MAG TPA: hypothetical protein PLH56_01785, partial [Candidatus Omnitrophota bacterium]|nr:hypothetical protein [Candidatus Omnitrophota bacterium]
FNRKLIIELKIGPIKDEHIGQILSYEGMLLSSEDPTIRVMLVGNRVPVNIKRSLDHHGIAWKEISFASLREYLIKEQDVQFLELFNNSSLIEHRIDGEKFWFDEKALLRSSKVAALEKKEIDSSQKKEFDKNSLDLLWQQAPLFDHDAKDLKYLKYHLSFCKKLTDKVLALDCKIDCRINGRQYSFDDAMGIGPFLNIETLKSKIVIAPLRLTPKDLMEMKVQFRDTTNKIYRMGGLVRVDFFKRDDGELNMAFELAKKSFEVKKKVGTAVFFGDMQGK